MTERTIRTRARQLAGEFYEGTRSGRFRVGEDKFPVRRLLQHPNGMIEEVIVLVTFHEAFPDVKTYIKGHWPMYYNLARQQLNAMLGMSRVHENTKRAIFKALLEDREQELMAVEKARKKGKVLPELATHLQMDHT